MLALLSVVAAGCRHAAPPSVLPADWASLVAPIVPFAAMYRFECCQHRNLVAVVRGDGRALLVSIAAPPRGVVLEAWLSGEEGTLTRTSGRCTEALPSGRLPIGDGADLPLDASLAAFLLSGRLPAGVSPLPDRTGWVGGGGESQIAWRVAGSPPRIIGVEVSADGEARPLLSGTLSEHHGRVPGRLRLEAEGKHLELELVEWRVGEPVAAPAWLAAPPCEGNG